MAATLKYQGRQQSKSKNTESYKQTYVGTQQQIDVVISGLPEIGAFVSGKGYMTSYRKSCDDGPYWSVEVEYTIEKDSSFDNIDDTVVGKKSAQLSARSIQMPLESHDLYEARWNHYLIGKNVVGTPGFWETATNTILTGQNNRDYMWIKSLSERPTQPDANGHYWQILEQPTKPGVQYYELACFVVTISAKYKSARAAGNAISKSMNTITSPDEDFGLDGEWKYDDASVSYNGKHWIATSTYTRAVDEWDKDLYG